MTKKTEALIKEYGAVKLFINGDSGAALLGRDIQSGEAEFVTVKDFPNALYGKRTHCSEFYAMQALTNLCKRLKIEDIDYYWEESYRVIELEREVSILSHKIQVIEFNNSFDNP